MGFHAVLVHLVPVLIPWAIQHLGIRAGLLWREVLAQSVAFRGMEVQHLDVSSKF
jgi:hypothetical protein